MVRVVEAYEKKDGARRGMMRWDPSAGIITIEYTRMWVARTDTETADESVIWRSSLIPQMFQTDSYNPSARVNSVDPSRTDNHLVWFVEVGYSTQAPTQQNGNSSQNPMGLQTKWSTSTEAIQLPMTRDVNNDPIILSNGLPPNPPLMVTRLLTVFRAEQNEPVYPYVPMTTMVGRVNSGNYLNCDPGTLMLRSITTDEANADSIIYWNVKYEFAHNFLGWQPKIWNAGYMAYDVNVGAALIPILDVNGQEVTSPWPLDASGYPLTVSAIQAGSYTYTDVQAYETADFSSLGLVLP